MENMIVVAGVIGFWIFITSVVVVGVWDGGRKRESKHETLRRMVESGKSIDQELVDKLLGSSKRQDVDLRVSGTIMLSIAPGLALFAWILSNIEEDAFWPIFGAGCLVACIGVGLLMAAAYVKRASQADSGVLGQKR